MDMWPGIEKLRTAELGRLMVRPSVRGKMLLPSLMRAGFEHLAGVARTDLAFMICVPGLVRYYRALGARPFGGRIFQDPTGMSVPLVLILSDHQHLSRCGSIVAPISKRYYTKGDNPVLDLKPYRHLIEGERLPVEFDRSRIWEEVHELVEEGSVRPAIFDGLTEGAVKKLLDSGFVLGLGANEGIVREGLVDRELYVVLEGMFAVHSGGRQIALLGPGDMFGELAFFSSHGRRTADVTSLSAGRLLMLRRNFLLEFTKKDPESGFQLLLNMSKVMADRFATRIASDEDDQGE